MEKVSNPWITSLVFGLGLGFWMGFQTGIDHENMRAKQVAPKPIGIELNEVDKVVASIYRLMYIAECDDIMVHFNMKREVERWTNINGKVMQKSVGTFVDTPILETIKYRDGFYYLTSARGDVYKFKNGDLEGANCSE